MTATPRMLGHSAGTSPRVPNHPTTASVIAGCAAVRQNESRALGMARKLGACLLGLSLLIACEEGGGEPAVSVPLDEVPSKFAATYCTMLHLCNPLSYQALFAVDDCDQFIEKQFREQRFADIARSISARKTVYDGVSAVTCIGGDLAAFTASSCQYWWDLEAVPLCERMFAGTRTAGDTCDIDAECGIGRACIVQNNTCPGVCTARLALGMACAHDENCIEGLVCSTATKECANPAGEGEPCGGGVAPQCRRTHWCLGEDIGNGRAGVCKTELETLSGAEGAPCALAGPFCQGGLSCVVEGSDSAGLVARCRARLSSDGDCHVGRPNQCPDGEYCPLASSDLAAGNFSASCQPLPAKGEVCAPDSSDVRCTAGLRCDPDTNQCAALGDIGQICSTDALCYSGNCGNGICDSPNACAM
jgi:hypothetical protein